MKRSESEKGQQDMRRKRKGTMKRRGKGREYSFWSYPRSTHHHQFELTRMRMMIKRLRNPNQCCENTLVQPIGGELYSVMPSCLQYTVYFKDGFEKIDD